MSRKLYLLFFFIMIIVTVGFLPNLTGPDSGKFPCAQAKEFGIFTTDDTLITQIEIQETDDYAQYFLIEVDYIDPEDHMQEQIYQGQDRISFGMMEDVEDLSIVADWVGSGVDGSLQYKALIVDGGEEEEFDYTNHLSIELGVLYPGEERTVEVRFYLTYGEDEIPAYLKVPFSIYREGPQIILGGANVMTDAAVYTGGWDGTNYYADKIDPIFYSSVTLNVTLPQGMETGLRVENTDSGYLQYLQEPGPWTLEVPLVIGNNTISIELGSVVIRINLDRLPFSSLTINGTQVTESDIFSGDSGWRIEEPIMVNSASVPVAIQTGSETPIVYQGWETGTMINAGGGGWTANIPLETGWNSITLQPEEGDMPAWTLGFDIGRPPSIDLKINNNTVNISGAELFSRQAEVTVPMAVETASLNISVDPECQLFYRAGEADVETPMTGSLETGQWTAEVPLALGENKVTITSQQDWMLEITITRQAEDASPPGGGGGGGAAPAETPGATVDPGSNTLKPGDTQVEGDSSTSKVSDEDVDALLKGLEGKEGEDTVAQIQLGAEGEEGVNNYSLELSGSALNQLGSSAGSVGVLSPVGNIYLRNEAVEGMDNRAADNITISMSRTQHEGRPGISVSIKQGDNAVTTFAGSYSAEIRVPYVPGEGENLSALFVEYIHDDGTVEIINESRYDPEAKCLVFFVNHLSKFGVAYKPRLFADVPLAHWAKGSITFLASRGIIHGVSAQKFEPERYISKAEFIQMMANAFSAANVGKKALPSFKDVKSNEWYARAVGWTYANNISPTIAYADGRLGVNENIRREDVAVLINNLSLSLGLRIKAKSTPVAFSDTGGAASYAKSAISRISSVGIINGIGSGRFNPKGYCTRAEAAQIVSVLMSSM